MGPGPSIESGLCCLLQEDRRNGLNRSLLLLGGFRCRRFECGEDDGGSALNDLQTLCEKCGVSMIQTDVVGGIFSAVEADGCADNKGNRFGFGLAYRLGGYRSEEHTSELQSLRHLVCRL